MEHEAIFFGLDANDRSRMAEVLGLSVVALGIIPLITMLLAHFVLTTGLNPDQASYLGYV